MRLLFVSDVSIHHVIGGAERVLYEQTTRLAARGHKVHILTRRLPEHQSDCEVIRQVIEWRYTVNQNSPLSFFVSTLRNGKRLSGAICTANDFDCINFHQPFSALAVLMSPSCEGIRKVYTCHSLAFEEYASRNAEPRSFPKKMMRGFHIAVRRRIEKKVLGRSDRVIVLSEYTGEKLATNYGTAPERIVIIPGGIDLDRFHPADDKRSVRQRLGILPGVPLLFTVRNLVSRMGLENLISAMQDVIRAVPEARLVIGGSGPLKSDLEALRNRLNLAPFIHFAGFIPEEDLPRHYQAADLFILPTVELEGFGLVTLEALASGTPVLGTPVGGTQEILGRLDKRFLFEGTAPAQISRLIIETCRRYREQPEQQQCDSQRSRDFAKRNYSWDVNVEATERLFKNMTDRS